MLYRNQSTWLISMVQYQHGFLLIFKLSNILGRMGKWFPPWTSRLDEVSSCFSFRNGGRYNSNEPSNITVRCIRFHHTSDFIMVWNTPYHHILQHFGLALYQVIFIPVHTESPVQNLLHLETTIRNRHCVHYDLLFSQFSWLSSSFYGNSSLQMKDA